MMQMCRKRILAGLIFGILIFMTMSPLSVNQLEQQHQTINTSDSDEQVVKFTRIMPSEVPERQNDWIEITNFGSVDVELGGWTLERIRTSDPWISNFNEFTLGAGQSLVLTENPANLLEDGGIVAQDGNIILNNMPWLVDSGSALQLKTSDGIVADSIVFGGGITETEGWSGPAISVPGDGSPGLILIRGDGCTSGTDTDSSSDWEERWIRIGASIFCDGGDIAAHPNMAASASISPGTALSELLGWLESAEQSIHLSIYESMSPDLTNALLEAIERGVEVTILLEDGILDDSETKENQRGHAQILSESGAIVYWMITPSEISAPYAFIHSKVAVKDSENIWISSGNWKDSSLPPVGASGNREWSLFLDSEPMAQLILSRMAWDENSNHLHIVEHSSQYSPDDGWSLPSPTITPALAPIPDTTTSFRTKLLTCPDDCVDGLISEINSADESIRISVQYLDMDWYWGFGAENPILTALHDAAVRGIEIRILLNAYYADESEDIRDAVNLFNTDWNQSQGLDITARLMSTAADIWKLHNKGMLVDDDTVLVGSMNWGSSSMLRNREMSIVAESSELATIFSESFEIDWNRLDDSTDSDGDLLPDSWEVMYGLDRHSAAVIGTALSEQSMDPDNDGLNNLQEFQLGGNPGVADTDGDCIIDGEEIEFAQSLLRAPSIAMNSVDVDENGIPDGEQYGCSENPVINNTDGGENGNGTEPIEPDEEGGFVNIREDPLAQPGARALLYLMIISGVSVAIAAASMFLSPKKRTEDVLYDDSGYVFEDPSSSKAILSGTSFDDEREDVRARKQGKDDGAHGKINLDGFGFENATRDEVQFLLDQGHSIEEAHKILGENK
jgi:phosphatidylserine/phosphatidylglycerophosphate/cardiolipin synthase-like enzyme